jgi:hypothetical protein
MLNLFTVGGSKIAPNVGLLSRGGGIGNSIVDFNFNVNKLFFSFIRIR